MAVDPVAPIGLGSALGAEFTVPGLEELGGASAPDAAGGGFGATLARQLGQLDGMLDQASAQSEALASGAAPDVSTVVMEVERAALALQLAVQVRNRAVEAYQDLWRTQI
jgi:flagellar hook-basal body complex protein FliE